MIAKHALFVIIIPFHFCHLTIAGFFINKPKQMYYFLLIKIPLNYLKEYYLYFYKYSVVGSYKLIKDLHVMHPCAVYSYIYAQLISTRRKIYRMYPNWDYFNNSQVTSWFYDVSLNLPCCPCMVSSPHQKYNYCIEKY